MRYRVTGFLLLVICAVNLYAIITDIVQHKNASPFYYYLVVAAALVLGIYYLFIKKRRQY
jgi:hypothetical protein